MSPARWTTPTTSSGASAACGPTSRSSTSGCRRPTPTRVSRPLSRSVSAIPRSASSSSPSISRPTYAMRLLEEGTAGRGYLLKDRVADLDAFAEAIRRVGDGGSVIDPEVVSSLVGRRNEGSPLDELTDREREILAPDGGGALQPRHLRAPRPQPEDDREPREDDLPEARSAPGRGRSPPGPGRGRLPTRRRLARRPRRDRSPIHRSATVRIAAPSSATSATRSLSR